MAKPTTIPDWISDDDAAKIDTPSASKQAEGWLSGEKPPFQYFNWFWNAISKWIKWWDARTPEYNIAIDLEANEGDYETLVAYLADSPASGDRVRINIDQTLTVKMTIPAGIKLMTQKGVKIACATNLATALLEFGDTCETQGEFIIELSQTGTIVEGVAFNGDDNYHENIVIKNTSTGTLTTAFIVKASKKCNNVRGEVINSGGGTITNVLTDSSTLLSNHVNIRDGVNNIIHQGVDLPVVSGGTGAGTGAAALINLGLTAVAAEINTICDGVLIPQRAKFIYKDTDEIYINGGVYIHRGTTNQIVYWDSQLTYQFTSLGVSDWSYLYIDDSDLVTDGTNVITAARLTDSTTEPTWSDSKKGWYNGEDRCIFAVLTNGSSEILEFFHDGDHVSFSEYIISLVQTDIDPADWLDVTLSAPKFTTKVQATVYSLFVDNGTTVYYRTKDRQVGTYGHIVHVITALIVNAATTLTVTTNGSQIIEIEHGTAGACTSGVYTDGWYLPLGI